MEYLYTETPGYATTGNFVVERFGDMNIDKMLNPRCLIKNLLYAMAVTAVLYCFTDKKMNMREIALIALVSSLAKCLLL
jgi:hypothetical protein